MKKINWLGFLSLLSLIAVLGWQHQETGLYGFLGFIYFIRYFWVVPDELFILNVQKSATIAFVASMAVLAPAMFAASPIYGISAAVPMAFALSFAAATISFNLSLAVLEWREQRGTVG